MKALTLAILTIVLALFATVLANRHMPYILDSLFSPCRQSLRWKVDTVDQKFGLSKEEFVQDAKEAAQIWDSSYDKNLFMYDPQGQLSINLIFDERQSISNQIGKLENTLQNEKGNIQPKIKEYQDLSLDFKKRLANLNNEILLWNKQGGAPPDVYDRLTKEQNDLQQDANRLNVMAKDLNISADKYNVNVNKLNSEINTFNQALKERPEEGIYEHGQNRIEVYFNINRDELVHTLAHEMGHALSLGHASDPKAIMYPNATQSLIATESDIAAIREACRSLL